MSRADPNYGTSEEFQEALQKATNMKELATSFRSTFVRHHRRASKRYLDLTAKISQKVKPFVIWFAGPTGCGKTRTAYEEAIARGTVWLSPASKMEWFDGYDGHDTAIFDDFRASGNRFSYILRIIDRYPMDVPVKGGFVYWNPKYIVFTCPRTPSEEFVNRETGEHYEDLNQMLRRIDETRVWVPQLKAWQVVNPPA